MIYSWLRLLSFCWVVAGLLNTGTNGDARKYNGIKTLNNEEILQYDYVDKWWETLRPIPEINLAGQSTRSYDNDKVKTYKINIADKNKNATLAETISKTIRIITQNNSKMNANEYDVKTEVSTVAADKIYNSGITEVDFALIREAHTPVDKAKDGNSRYKANDEVNHKNVEKKVNALQSPAINETVGKDESRNSPALERDFKRILGRFEHEKHRSEDTFKILDVLTKNASATGNDEEVKKDFYDMVTGFKVINDLKLFPGLNVSFDRIVEYYNFTAQQFGDAAVQNLNIDQKRQGGEDLPADIKSCTSSLDLPEGITLGDPSFIGHEEMSQFLKYVYNQKARTKEGYFTTFLVMLFEAISKKPEEDVRVLCLSVSREYHTLMKEDRYILSFGRPFLEVLQRFAEDVAHAPPDYVKHQAALLCHILRDKKDSMTPQVTAIIDYIDKLFENKEGDDLFKALETVHNFPNVTETPNEVLRNLTSALFAPYKRLAGTHKRRILVEAIYQEIERVKTASENAGSARRLETFKKKTRFDIIDRDSDADDRDVITYNTDRHLQTWTTSFYETGGKTKATDKNIGKSAIGDLLVTKAVYIQSDEDTGRYKVVKKKVKKHKEYIPPSKYHKKTTKQLARPNSYTRIIKLETSKKLRHTRLMNTKLPEKTGKSTRIYKLHSKHYARINPSTIIEYNTVDKNIGRTIPNADKQRPKAKPTGSFEKSSTQNRFLTTRNTYKPGKSPKRGILILIRHGIKTEALDKRKTKHLKVKTPLKQKHRNDTKINNVLLNKIREYSSYSDEEKELRFNMDDAMRHEEINIDRRRNEDDGVAIDNKLERFSSDSGDEIALKSNIYKGFGFNHELNRVNVYD